MSNLSDIGRGDKAVTSTAAGTQFARLAAAAPDMAEALRNPPIPPSDFDTEDGCRAYAEAVMRWLDTTCAAALAKAGAR